MAPNNLGFSCAVITGGAGGLGFAMAEWFSSEGKKVIIVGRTEEKLQTAAKHLKNAPYYVLDTGDFKSIPSFVEKVTNEHPEVDCIINNAGVQRPLKIKEFDLASADQEIDINIRGPMYLAIKFLPHLKNKPHGTIINVTSVLGFIPFSIVNPVYNGTKAWGHFWSLNLRTQLKDTNIRVIEVAPPGVGTDLHRDREDPDDNKKEKNPNALTVEEFMDDFKKGMQEGRDLVSAGIGLKVTERWNKEFGLDYENAADGYKA